MRICIGKITLLTLFTINISPVFSLFAYITLAIPLVKFGAVKGVVGEIGDF